MDMSFEELLELCQNGISKWRFAKIVGLSPRLLNYMLAWSTSQQKDSRRPGLGVRRALRKGRPDLSETIDAWFINHIL